MNSHQPAAGFALGGTASEGDILEENKVERKKKTRSDLEAGVYGRFEDEKHFDDHLHDASGELKDFRTSSSSI